MCSFIRKIRSEYPLRIFNEQTASYFALGT